MLNGRRRTRANLAEAARWSVRTLTRLLAISPNLDRYDRATIRAVVGALDPAKNPRLRPCAHRMTKNSNQSGRDSWRGSI